jgi:shikimate dehydrogenase
VAPRPAGQTRLYAVLGHPVDHSLSPLIQNAAFRAAKIDAAYVALDVPPGRLAEVLGELHAAGFSGLNLTAPHKEAARPLVVGATEEAKRSGAVNTLRREESGWLGHATDGPGFAAWIASLGIDVRGARVLLLGGGGAARSIAPALASLEPSAIRVVSRDGARARGVAGLLRETAGPSTEVTAAALAERSEKERGCPWDLLVRAFSSESVDAPEASWWEDLDPKARVLDLNYGARAVDTRKRAAAGHRRFEDGLGMLLHQGALSYEFWTGEPAPLEAMRAALPADTESH